ncbi:MAG: TldD/PmbA family protein [Parasporobacterium sp.]|nr:TldD/PmbA family protein [Parasporobacterium sp.]
MVEHIKNILENTPCDGYEITDTKTKGWEFYFIGHRLDQNRAKDVEHIQVKVYKKSPDGAYLGSASGEIAPTAGKEEAAALIEGLLRQAAYVKNPAYALNPRAVLENGSGLSPESHDTAKPLPDICADYLKTMKSAQETENAYINSYEIFVKEVTKRYLNSSGTDETFTYPESMAEVVVNARKAGEEIELYRMYTSGTCDAEGLRKEINETLAFGKDRLDAKPTPNLGKADLILSTDAALQVYDYFIYRMNAAYKVQKFSDWETGTAICPDGSGDKVTLRAVASLPNSSKNFPLDDEGAPIRDAVLIKDGVPVRYWGSRQFCQYLGIEDTSKYYNFTVDGGRSGAEELRSGDFLEVVEFSDFQVHPITGAIAGEIRLGYLHRDGGVRIVSGGSVSGSMRSLVSSMRFSGEMKQYDNIRIPAVTKLYGVNITGME